MVFLVRNTKKQEAFLLYIYKIHFFGILPL